MSALAPGNIFCDICKTCTCLPSENSLIHLLAENNPAGPTTEEDVAWLSRFYIVGHKKASPNMDPEPTYFITDICRRRRDEIHIRRGKVAIGVNFGNTNSIRGDGASEVLSMKSFDVAALARRPKLEDLYDHWVVVHQRCYEAIFLRVLVQYERNDASITSHQSQTFYNALYESLPKAQLPSEHKHCQPEGLAFELRSRTRRSDYQDEQKKRRDYLCDPGSSDWLVPALSHWTLDPRLRSTDKTPLLQALTPDFKAKVSNPFEALPIDIAVLVALCLDTRDVLKLTLASPITSLKLDVAKFWKIKLRREIPWIWELIEDDVGNSINWRGAYFDVWDQCNWNASNRNLGLVNRKSIWRSCEKLVPQFLEKRAEILEREAQQESD